MQVRPRPVLQREDALWSRIIADSKFRASPENQDDTPEQRTQSSVRRTGTVSTSQTQLGVSVQGEETFHVASHLSQLGSFIYLTGERAREAKSMMAEEESGKTISKIQNQANVVLTSIFLE